MSKIKWHDCWCDMFSSFGSSADVPKRNGWYTLACDPYEDNLGTLKYTYCKAFYDTIECTWTDEDSIEIDEPIMWASLSSLNEAIKEGEKDYEEKSEIEASQYIEGC